MRDSEVIVRGSDRPNLFFGVQRVESEADEFRAVRRLLAPLDEDGEHANQSNPSQAAIFVGSGIIYTATTRAARETAEWLQGWGISADFYHGQRSKRDRLRVQDAFMAGDLRIVAATNAFGLGIDKPDVRFVLHRDIPVSLEAYYQEAGRAGRDGKPAHAVLLYRESDLGRAAFLSGGGRLDREDIATVCSALLEHGELAPRHLAALVKLSQPTLLRVIAALEAEDIVGRRRGRLRFLQPTCDPDAVSLEAEERRRAYDASRLAMMRGYAESASCRREYILNYFGEAYNPSDCQHCDISLKLRLAPRVGADGPFSVGQPVRHATWGEGIVQRATGDSLTVLFDAVGFKTFDLALVHERGLLEPSDAAPFPVGARAEAAP